MAGGVTWLTSPARDAQYVSDHMSGRLSAGSAVWGHKNVLDLLPNVTVRSKRGTGDRGSCRGRRTGRRGGEGGRVQGRRRGLAGRHEDRLDDPRAQWRTVHLRLEVQDDLGQAKWNGQLLPVGLALSRDMDFGSTPGPRP